MGREARAKKERVCKNCQDPLETSAEQLRGHVHVCRLIDTLGLARPERGVFRPTYSIVHLTDEESVL